MKRACVAAVLASWAVHGLALVAMLTVLAPGVDMQATVASRAAYIAAHPDAWRLGWFAWQVTAASDLVVSLALVGVAWRSEWSRMWALFGLGATLLALMPDQLGEYMMVTTQVEAARLAAGGHELLEQYLKCEANALMLSGTFGCAGYVAMSLGWLQTVRLLARENRPAESGAVRAFTWAGAAMCVAFAACAEATAWSVSHATVDGGYPGFTIAFALNAVAFPVLMLWMLAMAWLLRP